MRFYSILFVGFVLISSCFDKDKSKPDSTLVITNNANKDIVTYMEFKNPLDTLLPIESLYPTAENIEINLVVAGENRSFPDAWKANFERQKDKVLMLFLFSRDSIEMLPWKQISENYVVLKRYDLTLDYLQQVNWMIEYP